MSEIFGKIWKGIRLVLNVFWQKIFLVLVLFVVVAFLIGGVFFYLYSFKTKDKDVVAPLLLSVNQVLLDSVFSKWDSKEIKFEEAISREFPNLFKEIVLPIPSTEATSTLEISTSSEDIL